MNDAQQAGLVAIITVVLAELGKALVERIRQGSAEKVEAGKHEIDADKLAWEQAKFLMDTYKKDMQELRSRISSQDNEISELRLALNVITQEREQERLEWSLERRTLTDKADTLTMQMNELRKEVEILRSAQAGI